MRDNASITAETSALLIRAAEKTGSLIKSIARTAGDSITPSRTAGKSTAAREVEDEVDKDEAILYQKPPLPLLPGRQKLKMLPRKELTRTTCVS